MANGVITYGDLSPRTAAWASTEMLENADNVLVLSKLGATRAVPKNSGDTVKFRRYVPFEVSTVPLQEGVTPNPQMMTHEDVVAQLKQYGNFTILSDWIQDTHEDPILQEVTREMGRQAAGSAEQVVYNAIKGGTSVIYANGANRAAVNTAVTLNKLRKAARQLYSQKAQKITRILDSSPDYGVSSVEGAYVVVCHSDCIADVRGLAGFTSTADYGTRRLISPYEFGAVEDFRFIASPDLAPWEDAGGVAGTMKSTTGTNADVYPMLIFGQDAFAVVPLKGANSLTPIVSNARASESDPLAQRSTVGYKFAMTATILNELWMVRLEVAVTAL
jgi:N4-gp56 family major capsid protein